MLISAIHEALSSESGSATFQIEGTHVSCYRVRTSFLAKLGEKFRWTFTASELQLQ